MIHIFIWQDSVGKKNIIGANISQSKSSAKDVGGLGGVIEDVDVVSRRPFPVSDL